MTDTERPPSRSLPHRKVYISDGETILITVKDMGKRCEELNCPYLASDGTCLLEVWELPDKCPARETTKHEEKDEWMKEKRTGEKRQRRTGKTDNGGINVWSLEKYNVI